MITVKTFICNPFQENTYILYDETGECVIVDAGCYTPDEQESIDSFIAGNNLRPVKLLNTHGHIDHIAGIEYLSKKYKIELYMHADDVDNINRSVAMGAAWGFNIQVPSCEVNFVEENDNVTFGNSTLKVIALPGHTKGGVGYYNAEQKIIMVGDTLFRGSIGRTDLPGGDYETIIRSIIKNLLPLGDEVRYYSGHGESSTLGHERRYNPFVNEHPFEL
ncbi:MBL fold metallo-hydrolase [Acetobacteroides hydrogenigenes]|uniref:Glyoxylase-like metal-dependent hydrolase (Beta-lactamase superfamily II) n=1 Tax=Acetobacteroides hydrogenigenes TaxID=979970 RepID=A0A4R2EYI6_9BACT|nr:MBL fold metallo-hydrolase [Acetobacteroides hydrogenigenes]TCN72997.1 glyoxylase-like metal-dependent hydrolase (beta-lactamase superfamily II) [Acetobacteroides hydrogenigenes]